MGAARAVVEVGALADVVAEAYLDAGSDVVEDVGCAVNAIFVFFAADGMFAGIIACLSPGGGERYFRREVILQAYHIAQDIRCV